LLKLRMCKTTKCNKIKNIKLDNHSVRLKPTRPPYILTSTFTLGESFNVCTYSMAISFIFKNYFYISNAW